jgi:CheY-like chemotaxis protein/anti-sigma regulatory factor (Ser/Thr protein kinase)
MLEHLNSIQVSSYVLLNLINDILDYSKIEANKLDIIPEYFSLTELLDYHKRTFENMFLDKDIKFICEFDPKLPKVLFGDEKRVQQIITNILTNAFKYTPSWQVVLRAYEDESKNICFEVEDTGIGIRDEDFPRLFTAFEQLDQVKNKKVGGTGLGLAITHRLCLLMNGSITARSEYGVGSCFTVTLPLPEGTERDLAKAADEVIEFDTADAKVLVVDDIEVNIIIASSLLESYGIVNDCAYNGQQALEMAQEKDYDIIFMDHMMPVMDGVEATLAIRALGGRCARVPIIALTANAVSGAADMFFANGFSGFLSKPIDAGELARSLLKHLPKEKIIPKHVEEPADKTIE